MSWLFSRALVVACSEVISSDGALYAPSSATPTPQAFSLPVKTTDACPRFRSGMTCERLTDDRGEAVLTWCLEASRVKGSAPPGTAQDLTTHAPDSGQNRPASLAKYDPATSSWRTHQCSLLMPRQRTGSGSGAPRMATVDLMARQRVSARLTAS